MTTRHITSPRPRVGFTLVEAMVVLAIFGIVAVAASMTFSSMLRSVKKSRGALAAMTGTRATLEFMMEEGRNAGGEDLPPNARVLISKGGGQKNTDILWLIRQAPGYSTCAVSLGTGGTATSGDLFLTTLRFFDPTDNVIRSTRCCFEAGPPEDNTPELVQSMGASPPFRRSAVIIDATGKFVPVFLSGSPTPGDCRVRWEKLPGIDAVVNTSIGNMPTLSTAAGAEAVLADVKKFYIDFDADRVQPPFGALYAHVEVDGNLTSEARERQRLSSNAYDFRASVGYDDPVPQAPEDDFVDDDEDGFDDDEGDDLGPLDDEVPFGNQALIEKNGDPGGWRDLPIAVTTGREAAPVMLGVAIQTGVPGETAPDALPWSTRRRAAELAQVMTLVGRVTFRSEGAR